METEKVGIAAIVTAIITIIIVAPLLLILIPIVWIMNLLWGK